MSRPTANQLAQRDPALAALLGALPSDFGTDYGADFGSDFDDDDYGHEFGRDYYNDDAPDFGAAAPVRIQGAGLPPGVPPPASAAHMMQVWTAHHQAQANTARRAMLLDPNKGSTKKVERYTFSLSASIAALGTGQPITASSSPDTQIRPQRVTANSPSPGFVILSEIKVANVSVTVGGDTDSWQFNSNAVGQSLDLPTLTPSNRASFAGTYSGLVPSPLTGTGAYPFILSFTGPAAIVA